MAGKYFIDKDSITVAGVNSLQGYSDSVGLYISEDMDMTKLMCHNHIKGDLTNTYFNNGDGKSEFTGSINVTREDWEGQATFLDYKLGSNALTSILPGTSPHFKELIKIDTSGTYTISRTSTELTIGSTTYYKEDFVDGVIPTRLIVVLQGAGGGGSSNAGLWNGSGGGSGALNSAVISLSTSWTLVVGAGGTGGLHDDFDLYFNPGSPGGATTLTGGDSSLVAGGGGGAQDASSALGSSPAAGVGGTASTTIGSYILKHIGSSSGVAGGKGADSYSYNGQIGTNPSKVTLDCITKSGRSDDYKSLTLNGQGAGTRVNHDKANMGGTGAGSWFGTGGNAVWGTNGTAGGSGAGGGGGSWAVGIWYRGGKGGNGVAVIYY